MPTNLQIFLLENQPEVWYHMYIGPNILKDKLCLKCPKEKGPPLLPANASTSTYRLTNLSLILTNCSLMSVLQLLVG